MLWNTLPDATKSAIDSSQFKSRRQFGRDMYAIVINACKRNCSKISWPEVINNILANFK